MFNINFNADRISIRFAILKERTAMQRRHSIAARAARKGLEVKKAQVIFVTQNW